jgi:hypothetical protein
LLITRFIVILEWLTDVFKVSKQSYVEIKYENVVLNSVLVSIVKFTVKIYQRVDVCKIRIDKSICYFLREMELRQARKSVKRVRESRIASAASASLCEDPTPLLCSGLCILREGRFLMPYKYA